MSILSPIKRFSSGLFTYTRPSAGSRASGAYVAGASTTLGPVDMAIQPLTGRDLKTVPEGQHVEDFRMVLTTADLKVKDRITFKDETWEVYKVEDWTHTARSWTRAYINRITLAVS